MAFFNKKPKSYDDVNNASFDDDFYRGPEYEDGIVGEEDDNELIPPAPIPAKKPAQQAGSGSWRITTPHSMQDGMVIADYLVHGYTVVMNIEALDHETTVRLIDFLLGAVHVLGGELRRVSQSTFVVSPRKGEVTDDAARSASDEELR